MKFLIPWGNFIQKSGGIFTGVVRFQATALFESNIIVQGVALMDDIDCQFLDVHRHANFYERVRVESYIQISYDAISVLEPQIRMTAVTGSNNYFGFTGTSNVPALKTFIGADDAGNIASLQTVGAMDPFPTNLNGVAGNWNVDNVGRQAPAYSMLLIANFLWS